MFKALLSMCFWVVVARWAYAEIQLNAPGMVPALDALLARVQIPTHDKWDTEALKKFVADIDEHAITPALEQLKNESSPGGKTKSVGFVSVAHAEEPLEFSADIIEASLTLNPAKSEGRRGNEVVKAMARIPGGFDRF